MLIVEVCAMLGIDDPIEWMEQTDAKTQDLWVAYLLIQKEKDK